ncbi:MAG: HEPN domain-containing protein [Methanobacteriota archaeon]
MALRPETKHWWAQAKRDLRIAERNHANRDYEVSVSYCEQAAQKALKALLLRRTSQMPPTTHNLVELGRLVGVGRQCKTSLRNSRLITSSLGIPMLQVP